MIAKDNKVKKHQLMKQAIKRSNEPIGKIKIPNEIKIL